MDEDTLKKYMDDYADIRHKIELMEANKKTVIDKILEKHLDVKKEIDEADEELGVQLEKAQVTEKSFKKILDSAIKEYATTIPIKDKVIIKTKLLTVSIIKGEVVYNSDILDGYVLTHPELLNAREEKPPSTRVTLNKL